MISKVHFKPEHGKFWWNSIGISLVGWGPGITRNAFNGSKHSWLILDQFNSGVFVKHFVNLAAFAVAVREGLLQYSWPFIDLYFNGILPKGPHLPCLRMADRALLTGYPRFVVPQCYCCQEPLRTQEICYVLMRI